MTPNPDEVREALAVLVFWGGDGGPDPEKAMANALVAAAGWRERHEAEERAHGRRRDEAAHEMAVTLQLAEARERARVVVAGRQR